MPDAACESPPYNDVMSNLRRTPCPVNTTPSRRWSVGGLLLETLADRDFTAMADCFEPAATMRALLPRGPAEYHGATEITEAFRFWFGGADLFEVFDAAVSDVGTRLHLAWRLRVDRTPRGDLGWHVIEQQVFADANERIEALDLLCSGFVRDTGTERWVAASRAVADRPS
jgi:hypothetical protein